MTTPRSRGRPRFEPTDEHRENVEILRASGMSLLSIAAALGIAPGTLKRHFLINLRDATARRTAAVLIARYRAAVGGKGRVLGFC